MSARTKRLKALGNAVVPDCAGWVGHQIMEHARREAAGAGEETAGVVSRSSDLMENCA